jgi:hypothetical protein
LSWTEGAAGARLALAMVAAASATQVSQMYMPSFPTNSRSHDPGAWQNQQVLGGGAGGVGFGLGGLGGRGFTVACPARRRRMYARM